ncbi:MAG: MFS transporter [Actinomycetota bacterium]
MAPARWVRSPRALERYALVHATSVAGDTLLAIGLADSIFFSIPVDQAKTRVALYLVLTMAPLAVAVPVLARLLERWGFRRTTTIGAAAVRAAAAVTLIAWTDTWPLYPLAFIALVASRIHLVAKNSLTATYEDDAGLVRANAQLSRVAAISATVAVVPGAAAARSWGAAGAVLMAAAAYGLCALLSVRLPRTGARHPSQRRGESKLPREVETAGWLMAGVRAGHGFLLILVAFALRRVGEPDYWLAVAFGAFGVGTFLGAILAPRLTREGQEVPTVLAALLLAAAAAGLALVRFTLPGLVAFSFVAGFAGETARLAFQSGLQRAAGLGSGGAGFVRFEVRFQLAWVAGALVPAMLPIGFRLGLLSIAGMYAAVGLLGWVLVRRRVRREPAGPAGP